MKAYQRRRMMRRHWRLSAEEGVLALFMVAVAAAVAGALWAVLAG